MTKRARKTYGQALRRLRFRRRATGGEETRSTPQRRRTARCAATESRI
eukprot:CAMPEP_0175182158 /NCGR_PEP_ID=MMETSP0093-20121207/174_1 /TAXON_ID=311494 /ORGANISM="Alexandrium monilatum, Strain CCMP3105" /LENGTH=47 /DNA_ID= /DNA_START= /DNA_END= /DNA_ORIENTATION=